MQQIAAPEAGPVTAPEAGPATAPEAGPATAPEAGPLTVHLFPEQINSLAAKQGQEPLSLLLEELIPTQLNLEHWNQYIWATDPLESRTTCFGLQASSFAWHW